MREPFGVGLAMLIVLGSAVLTGIGTGVWVWHNAPPVGGEWWFYLRAAFTIVGAFVGIKVGALLGWLLTVLVGGLYAFAVLYL